MHLISLRVEGYFTGYDYRALLLYIQFQYAWYLRFYTVSFLRFLCSRSKFLGQNCWRIVVVWDMTPC